MGFYVIMLLFGLVIYFIPAYFAYSWNHKQKQAIIVLNIFAGWTFLGWVAALVWAMKKE